MNLIFLTKKVVPAISTKIVTRYLKFVIVHLPKKVLAFKTSPASGKQTLFRYVLSLKKRYICQQSNPFPTAHNIHQPIEDSIQASMFA